MQNEEYESHLVDDEDMIEGIKFIITNYLSKKKIEDVFFSEKYIHFSSFDKPGSVSWGTAAFFGLLALPGFSVANENVLAARQSKIYDQISSEKNMLQSNEVISFEKKYFKKAVVGNIVNNEVEISFIGESNEILFSTKTFIAFDPKNIVAECKLASENIGVLFEYNP